MQDFGLSTPQLSMQSWFKQCGRADLLKGLTQHCCPEGNIYGRTANSLRAWLVIAQPMCWFRHASPCFATPNQLPLS